MAKKKVLSAQEPLQTWEDVDNALNLISQKSSVCAALTALYNKEEQKRREKAVAEIQPIQKEIEELEQKIKDFSIQNRADFGDAKTKELNHGTVSFRFGTPAVTAMKNFAIKSALELIKRSAKYCGLFVRVKEELNKEQVLQSAALYENAAIKGNAPDDAISPETLAKFGLQVTKSEGFYYDLNLALGNSEKAQIGGA